MVMHLTNDESRLATSLTVISPARISIPVGTICLFTTDLTSPVDIYMHMPELRESPKHGRPEDLRCSRGAPRFISQAGWRVPETQGVMDPHAQVPRDNLRMNETPWQAKTIARVSF